MGGGECMGSVKDVLQGRKAPKLRCMKRYFSNILPMCRFTCMALFSGFFLL